MQTTEIQVSVEKHTAIVRFMRPDSLNALTDTMLAETRAAMQAVELDHAIRAVVLTGDDRAFCSGGDLKASAGNSLPPYDRYLARFTQSEWHNYMRFLSRYPKPVIAAIEGYCLGGGLEIALRCDFAVGSQSATIGMTEARHSLFPILGVLGRWRNVSGSEWPRNWSSLADGSTQQQRTDWASSTMPFPPARP